MDYVTLGRTEIKVCKNGFGALPIQRISFDSAKEILLHAYNSGINFFDTARFYTDSEEKIGYALSDVRDKIYIATKTAAQNADDFWKDLNTSLNNMKTDYIDIYQFHNPSFCPKPNDGTGLYEAMLEAKAQGKIRFIGLTNHRLAVAQEAIDSGLYDTIQFPFCYLATDKDIAIVENCKKNNLGFIAMIYSQNINKVCAVCQMAHKKSEDEMYCDIKKQAVSVTDTACDKFKYDILKRHVRLMRKLKTNFNPEDFSL